jgi:hypothetical protein
MPSIVPDEYLEHLERLLRDLRAELTQAVDPDVETLIYSRIARVEAERAVRHRELVGPGVPASARFTRRSVSDRYPNIIESTCNACGGTVLSSRAAESEMARKETRHVSHCSAIIKNAAIAANL